MPSCLRIAVQGCCHGELNAVYAAIEEAERRNNYKVDLLIVGGDFQSIRNLSDLQCMAVPAKYRRLGDFADYYSGKKTAPVLTLFVGGNHEASNYLQELFYGGWVAPNIYYLGAANVVNYGGLRIGGISGIWSKQDYVRGHKECAPYDSHALRSVYHVRQFEVKKLLCMSSSTSDGDEADRCDLFLSHDWPRGIEQAGDTQRLVSKKPFFRAEIARNDLGSPANEELLNALRPRYWFSAHLHVRFEAVVNYAKTGDKRRAVPSNLDSETPRRVVVDAMQPIAPSSNPDEIALDLDDDEPQEERKENPDEIVLDLDDLDAETETNVQDSNIDQDAKPKDESKSKTMQHNPEEATKETLEQYKARLLQQIDLADAEDVASSSTIIKDSTSSASPDDNQTFFLALDKCLPRRQFLEIMTIPTKNDLVSSDSNEPPRLQYDAKWLAITKAFSPHLSRSMYQKKLPERRILEQEVKHNQAWVSDNIKNFNIPFNFVQTAPAQNEQITERTESKCFFLIFVESLLTVLVVVHENPQTTKYCEMLQITPW